MKLSRTPLAALGALCSALGADAFAMGGMRMAASAAELKECKKSLESMIDRINCNPIMVRLAWHDSGTYDKAKTGDWPNCGGANGSIRFSPEIEHGANKGLSDALKYLTPIKKKHESVGWADLMQMASVVAIELAGGPKIELRYGRKDATGPEQCAPEGNLPDGNPPFGDGAPDPQSHLRNVFYRMGFDDRDIVALSGAHTLGRAFKDRSGEGAEVTKYTDGTAIVRKDGKEGQGRKGGSSWTTKWLTFDNSYFNEVPDNDDPELLKMSTDSTLFIEPEMMPIAREYKESQEKFFQDYAIAHKKLSELGVAWEVEGGITGV